MVKRVLIVHGWLHSVERYTSLAQDLHNLLDCEVELFSVPGFGGVPAVHNIPLLSTYVKLLCEIITQNKYDFIIGHSMGGNIILRAVEKSKVQSNIILLSPVYKGVGQFRLLAPLCPVLLPWLLLIKKVNCRVTTLLLKLAAMLTVNKWNQIDNSLVSDVRKANTVVAIITAIEMIYDKWKVTKSLWYDKQVYLIIGQKDRILKKNKLLQLYKDLPNCKLYCIPNIGHTAIIEDYDRLLKTIYKIIKCS